MTKTMQILNDHQSEAISGGNISLVFPNIDLGINTLFNIGVPVALFDGATATNTQDNDAWMALLSGIVM